MPARGSGESAEGQEGGEAQVTDARQKPGTIFRLHTTLLHPLNSLFLGLTVVSAVAACATAQERVLNAAEIAAWTLPYKQELDICRIEAKKLPRDERFASYLACEEVATERACKRLPSGARGSWTQCDGVKP